MTDKAMTPSTIITNPDDNKHPIGFRYIFWGELAERASFYGMKTLLLLYMIQKLGYTDANSASVVSLFTAFCYILPIVGGYVADHWLGKFKTIIYFAIPYILGHIILGTFNTEVGLYTALLLLAGGSGSIKPNISTLMGLMYQKAGKTHLMTQAFSWFYMAINIGAAITTFSLPFIRDHYGYGPAFMAPTILMAVSLGIFYLGKKHYPTEDVRKIQREKRTPEQKKEDLRVLLRISGLFILIVFFWSIFDQSYSTWTLFARDYMNLDLNIFGWNWHIPPDAVQSLNPVLIVIMTPLFAWIWSKTDKDETHKLSSPRKMLIGFFLVILCMGLMTVAGYFGIQNKVSILWELGAYILITMAELCISVVGLQLAFEEAPERMKSMITGIWLFTVFLGDSLAAWFSRIYTTMTPANYFGIMTIMIAVVTVLFYFVGRRFEHRPAKAV
ncbi:Amino acid/peptide transporter [Candidatus Zixiibacteriota bacterium]|nr:Amino acid/peptide transporter [candidate division Zixibacteria bacterium]